MSTYKELLEEAKGPRAQPWRKFPPDVAKARQAEQRRRASQAQKRAQTLLGHRHKAEYDELYRAMRAEVHAESGPLPGDDQ